MMFINNTEFLINHLGWDLYGGYGIVYCKAEEEILKISAQ
jgi:hypothetical protein